MHKGLYSYKPSQNNRQHSLLSEEELPMHLAMAHISLKHLTSLKHLDSSTGYGHKILCLKMERKDHQQPRNSDRFPRQNFRKADCAKYKTLTDSTILDNVVYPSSPDKSYREISNLIDKCAIQARLGSRDRFRTLEYWNLG